MDNLKSYTSTVGGYVVLGSLLVGYWWYTGKGGQARRGAAPVHQQERKQPAVKKEKEKDKDAKAERAARRKQAAKEASTASASAEKSAAASANDYSSEEQDNREFAWQYSNAMAGTKLASSGRDDKRPKSVKQSRATEVKSFADETKESGVDADDDHTSAADTTSPLVRAADSTGVADMLEKAPEGPAILRLTDTDKAEQKANKHKNSARSKTPEPTETKKARQNRKKAEAAKQLREETEAERRIKMEAQRRLARESEGRPAKDGSAFMASTAAAPSVWANKVAEAKAAKAQAAATDPNKPLDTFSGSAGTASPDHPSDSWVSMNLSEEDQMAMVLEDTEWNTVPSKKAKKKAEQQKQANGDGGASETKRAEPEAASTAATTAAAPAAAQPARTLGANGKTARPRTIASQSSFAALSSKESESEEQEWDV